MRMAEITLIGPLIMKQKIINVLKYNKFVYFIYYYLMSFLINLFSFFVKTDDKLIIFNSFAGRRFDDSPRAIYEIMKSDFRFKDYNLVWTFHEPQKYENIKKIKTDGILYFKTVLSARVWITNSSFERGLNFKGKNTLYFNTWHGTPIKKMGSDINNQNTSFRSKATNHVDVMMSQGTYETEIFSKTFGIPKSNFLEVGLPRNDVLVNYTVADRMRIRHALGISDDKTVILYAPTFREYEKDENLGVVARPPIDLKKWERLLPNYVLLFRAHYEVSRILEIQENSFIHDMTVYPNLNDLFIAADILISDYSSVFFDYSITGKVMLHFTYDYEKYSSKRGMYFDIREYISGADNEDGIIKLINSLDIREEQEKTKYFRSIFVNYYGHASQDAVDFIAKELRL